MSPDAIDDRVRTVVLLDEEEKVRRLGVRRDVSVRTALVYSGSLSPAVASDGYFDAVVNADELMSDD